MKKGWLLVALGFLAVGGLITWQAEGAIEAARAERERRLELWAAGDRDKDSLADEYRAICESWGMQAEAPPGQFEERPTSYGACVVAVASHVQSPVPSSSIEVLAKALDGAVEAVELPVPLRWM